MNIGKVWGMASRWGVLLCVVVSTAMCGAPEQEQAEIEAATDEMASQGQSGRASMEVGTSDERLHEHLEHMSRIPADSLALAMPTHLQTVGAILDELDPAYMGMQSDTVWRTTLDSVQNDLAQMRDMRIEQLRAFMPEHSRRIERLIFLHDSAMGTER